MLFVTCSTCGTKLRGNESMAGKKGKCPKCGFVFLFLAPSPPPPLADAPPSAKLETPPAETERPSPVSAAAPPASPPVAPPPPLAPEPLRNVPISLRETPPAKRDESTPFLANLRTLYATLGLRDATDSLPALAALFDGQRQAAADRQHRFQTDLAQLYVSIAPPHLERHLALLGDQLSRWRAKSKSRMAKYFAQLPDDDPLRCPISLFGVMERGRLETAHTAVLAWMLDPRREHGFQDTLLVALLRRLCGPDQVDAILVVDKCEPEFPIDDGRLDVLVQGTARQSDATTATWSWLLMIEAKIDANEGVQQLKRYDKWAHKWSQGREVIRVFLTPEGRNADTAAEDWTPLSFLDLVCLFRKCCSTLAHAPGYHFLRYYIAGVLKDVYRWNLPIGDPEFLDDPYNFLEYLAAVSGPEDLTP